MTPSGGGRRPALRIAQAIASRSWGGRERTPILLARGLRDRGHEVSVWADPDSPAGREAERLGFPLFPFRWNGYLSFSALRQVRTHLKTFDPQILHLHLSKDLWMTVPAVRLSGWEKPLFLTKHVGSFVSKRDPLHQWLYRRVDRLLTCSDVIRRNVLATTTMTEGSVTVSYAPVDLEDFRFDAAARRRLRRSWGVGPRDRVVGMAARLSPGKGHETLMKAAAFLRDRRFPVLFRMAGDASPDQQGYRRELIRLRDSLGLKGTFEFVGYVPDVPGFLSAVDVVVHAARAEAFGLAAVEALACGRPVVGRAGEGLDEILGSGRGGVLVPNDDPASWADTLEGLWKSRGRIARWSRQARGTARRFSLERLSADHEKWYLEEIEKKVAVRCHTPHHR